MTMGAEKRITGTAVVMETSATGKHVVIEHIVTLNDSMENFEEYLADEISAMRMM